MSGSYHVPLRIEGTHFSTIASALIVCSIYANGPSGCCELIPFRSLDLHASDNSRYWAFISVRFLFFFFKVKQRKLPLQIVSFFFNRKENGGEKWWVLRIFKDMQTQITKTYQRTAARRAISKNAANNKCWSDCGEMRTLDSKGDVVRATHENTKKVLWKGKHGATSQSITPTAGLITWEKWESKSHRLAILHSKNIYHSQHLEAKKMSINRGVHKVEVVHVLSGKLLQ